MNLGTKALQVIQTVAPTLATAAFGPVGGLAVAELEKVFGVKAGDNSALESAALTATPEQLLALKTADEAFQERMKELGISEEKLSFDDTASARQREMVVKDHTPAVLAYFITGGFFATLGYMLVYGKPAIGGDVMLVMVGSLGTAWATIVAYFFGSSASGVTKDKALADIAKQP
ncbi:MAG TPA: hypothetical protein VK803_07980 [Steroidobacteraceae bacterium]|jgi:hypothetical protein|nr:hypothetical protein [Steroidobacteraceae bacterium]